MTSGLSFSSVKLKQGLHVVLTVRYPVLRPAPRVIINMKLFCRRKRAIIIIKYTKLRLLEATHLVRVRRELCQTLIKHVISLNFHITSEV